MAQIYGLLFDVDGVIVDTEEANAQATIKMFEDLFGLRGVQSEDFAEGIGKGSEKYIQVAAEKHGRHLIPEQMKKAVQARQDNFFRIMKERTIPVFPGVTDLMEAARRHDKFRVAIATSSDRAKSQAVLESAEIPYKEVAYVTGSDIRNKKPDPDLFLTAAQKINVDPKNCLVIEDAPAGVEAAKAAGAKCIAVTNSTSADNLKQADKIVDSLEEVNLDMIMKMIGS